jgi:hypothetical protein
MTDRPTPDCAEQPRVALTAIDPWDFVTENGTVVRAHSIDAPPGGYELLVHLDHPLNGGGRQWSYFVVNSTNRGAKLSEVRTGLRAVCALTSLTEEHAKSETPFADIDYALSVKVLADLVVL